MGTTAATCHDPLIVRFLHYQGVPEASPAPACPAHSTPAVLSVSVGARSRYTRQQQSTPKPIRAGGAPLHTTQTNPPRISGWRVADSSTPPEPTPLILRVPHPRRRRGCGFIRHSVNHHGEFRSPILFTNQCWFRDASLHAHKCVFLA